MCIPGHALLRKISGKYCVILIDTLGWSRPTQRDAILTRECTARLDLGLTDGQSALTEQVTTTKTVCVCVCGQRLTEEIITTIKIVCVCVCVSVDKILLQRKLSTQIKLILQGPLKKSAIIS